MTGIAWTEWVIQSIAVIGGLFVAGRWHVRSKKRDLLFFKRLIRESRQVHIALRHRSQPYGYCDQRDTVPDGVVICADR